MFTVGILKSMRLLGIAVSVDTCSVGIVRERVRDWNSRPRDIDVRRDNNELRASVFLLRKGDFS